VCTLREDVLAMPEIWREDAVESCQIQSRAWDQFGQPGDGRSCASLRLRHAVKNGLSGPATDCLESLLLAARYTGLGPCARRGVKGPVQVDAPVFRNHGQDNLLA